MAASLKVVIAGSRNITDYGRLKEVMCEFRAELRLRVGGLEIEIVSGGARGVDTLAFHYAKENGLQFHEFKPDYARYSRGAPFKRNTEMAIFGDVLVVLWDGQSRGTQHMIAQMQKQNKPVYVYKSQV